MTIVETLLPVLVAELADDTARSTIEELARERRVCLVPVLDVPVDASIHVLEVTTPGCAEPLVVLAEPAGPPTDRGFPLRLHPYGSPPPQRSVPPPPGPLPSVRANRTGPTALSPRHTRELLASASEAPPKEDDEIEALVGRDIAGGKLVVEGLVGTGGMGAVYRARHKQLDKQIAVKVLHARFRDDLSFCARFHAEALAVSQLDHPNLVRILDYGQEPDGLLYLAMDYLSGVELEDMLELQGTMPLPRIVDIALQVSAGLGHAHARGIVHRDVKPSNILLVKTDDDEGRTVDLVKVCDFGIATQAGSRDLVGTPAYMSPEQCAGMEVDGRSDVYALGVILYELATGQVPFNHADATRIINMHLNSEPVPPNAIRAVDPRLEALILRMLAKTPEDRPQSMRELRNDLRALREPLSPERDEHGAGRDDRSSGKMRVAQSQQLPAVTMADPQAIAALLASDPVATLRESLATPERFATDARVIAAAMRMLLEKRELTALTHVVAILRNVASDANAGTRAGLAASLVRTLMDPNALVAVAQAALESDDEAAPMLLAGLGPAAAHALYLARIRANPTPSARARFVNAMRRIDAAAWPIVSQALARNVPGEAEQHDPRLAEDLLRAVPALADDAAGGIVAKYLRWGEPAVRRAAVAPLVALWGDRARALLLAVLLNDSDEEARVQAIAGLRRVRGIDVHVVRKIEDILVDGAPGASSAEPLKAAIADALGAANDDAREAAASALRRALVPKAGMLGKLRARGPAMPPGVVLPIAKAYLDTGSADAAKVIEELGRASEEPLRTHLLGLVGVRSSA